ncbi:MAG: Nramp family divalent metal transporter [Thalassotalea sp.]|nr:Nramp family divalent metal transporter [Thalassotalea sp.]
MALSFMRFKLGPGILITAAFIGPGTITTASLAGANFGFTLLWAVIFSALATYVLQEMSGRLGLATGQGLPEAIKCSITTPMMQKLALILVVAAIGIGNAAYEAGNIIGASVGLNAIIDFGTTTWSLIVAAIAGALLWFGHYKVLEKAFTVLVLLMSLVFITTLVLSKPDLGLMARGIVPSMPSGSVLTVLALVGTTLVPYNLFLHASMVHEKWQTTERGQAIQESRQDTAVSISLGALVTLAIVGTSASAFFNTGVEINVANISQQLQPVLGDCARYFFALGIFAAGITSAIAAPLAASYAVCGAMGWSTDLKHTKFRLVWLIVLGCGALFSTLGIKPMVAILFAQAANGLLLPFVAIFLLIAMNNQTLLGKFKNTKMNNLFGAFFVIAVSTLGLYKLAGLF